MSQLCKDCTHKNKDCTDKDTKHLIWCYMFNSKAREKARLKREHDKAKEQGLTWENYCTLNHMAIDGNPVK